MSWGAGRSSYSISAAIAGCCLRLLANISFSQMPLCGPCLLLLLLLCYASLSVLDVDLVSSVCWCVVLLYPCCSLASLPLLDVLFPFFLRLLLFIASMWMELSRCTWFACCFCGSIL